MQFIANRYYSKTKQLTTYILLFIQLFLPIFVTFSSVAKAAQDGVTGNQMLETINGIDALMNNNSALKNSASEPTFSLQLSTVTASNGNIPALANNRSSMLASTTNNNKPSIEHDQALPTLGIKETPQAKQVESTEKQFVQSATQIAQGLANNNATEAAINYARNRGEGLLNQKISDWLNQYGKARVQISSNKTGDADLLLPLIDKPNSLLFSQVGIRANEQRSTTNLGLGYRQYQQNWMWGINSFYDYDISGGNARFGVGGELWAYYLKLAVNGYFRLTDWHQSFLHEMRDYDERPANGFDIRAEGYLPSYPHLGAYAKYEQYFGDGVNFSHNPTAKDLKDNPSAATFGLSYTPFPLLTLKTQVSHGDYNDSLIGVEFAYRFGMPLAAQLNPDNVDLMRSLAGNRYDFVDRNYNIVMQYCKQEILAISLPDSATAEAAQTIAIKATVQKAKYGLNKILWSAPELLAKGGKINETSATTINLVLPSYDEDNQGNKAYTLSAVGVDNEGNKSKAAVMVINVTQSKDGFAYFTLENPTPIPADGNQTYLAKVQLQNDKWVPLANKQVTFSVKGFSKGASMLAAKKNGGNAGVVMLSADGQRMGNPLTETTDAEGKINIKVKSDLAGQGELIATIANGKKKAVAIQFTNDVTTAKVRNVTLIDKKNSKVANGVDSFSYKAFVVDQFNNPLPDVDVVWSTTQQDKVVLLGSSSKTDANGRAIITLRSTLIAVDNVEVSAKYANTLEMAADRVVSFVADERTSKVNEVSLYGRATDKFADGKSSFTFSAKVVDGNGNPIRKSGLMVNWSHNKDPKEVLLSAATSPTDSNGIATIELKSTTTPVNQIVVSANFAATTRVEADRKVNFIAEEDVVKVGDVELKDPVNVKVADGKQSFTFSAQLVDSKNQPVKEPLIIVNWFYDKDDVKLLSDTSETDENGIATVILQSTTKAVDEVQISASSGNLDEINANNKVSFIADKSQAHIGSVLLDGSEVEKIADGVTSFSFTAQLVDNNNNPIREKGLQVDWSQNSGDKVTLANSSQTDENGITAVRLYSTITAVNNVEVSASYAGTASKSADRKVSFTANKGTAKLGEIKLIDKPTTHKIADGQQKFTFNVQLFDKNDNPIKQAGIIVYWGHDRVGKTQLNPTSETNQDGVATAELQSTTMAVDDIEVFARFGSGDKKTAKEKVSFIANKATATVKNVKLEGKIDRKVAHSSNNFGFTAQLVDDNGNPIKEENLPINWSTNQDSKVRFKDNNNISKTDRDGLTSITLERMDVAAANVVVSAKYANSKPLAADKPVSFITVSFGHLIVNGHDFPISAQFPTTGFRGAKFTIETQGAPASEFKWQSNQNWVSVQDGLVTFAENAASKTVTIKATHETGGDPIEYTFTLNNWFAFSGEKNWNDAKNWCVSNNGTMPKVEQLSQGKGKRAVGSLWSEWGKFSHYGIEDGYYWTLTQGIDGRYIVVKLDDGFSEKDSYTQDTEAVVCSKTL